MEPIFLYNKYGKPIAYIDDISNRITSINGKALGIIKTPYLYNYNGSFLGWFIEGWIIDLNGRYAFFTDDAIFRIAKPACWTTPALGATHAIPAQGAFEAAPVMPATKKGWSIYEDISFFYR